MATFLAILEALANVKALAGYIDTFVSAIVGWWLQRQKAETLADISDAISLQQRAKTQEDRYAAADAWQKALSRNRSS